MAQKASGAERTGKSSVFNLIPPELAAMGQKRIEEFANTQTEFFGKLQETNRQWLDRVQSEADLASEFAAQLTAAHSIPEAMTACQKWAARRLELAAEDGKHLVSDAKKFTEMGARLLSNGWLTKSDGGST
jgi:Phasin protein